MRKFTLLFLLFISSLGGAFAQCGPDVTVMSANLTGSPDSMWISPAVPRNDKCCGATGQNICVKVILTIDTATEGIIFNNLGANGGYYQVNCGTQMNPGSKICLSGPGPHIITFCKPGG